MALVLKKPFGGRPVARNQRLSPPEVKNNIRKLLYQHGEIEVHCLHDYYRFFFKKTLCAIDMGYSEGLLGYLRSLGEMIDIRRDGHFYFVSLNRSNGPSQQPAIYEREESENNPNIKKYQDHKQLFDKNSFIWNSRLKLLDENKKLMIEMSAFESALECYPGHAASEIARCYRYLEQFPDGIPLTNISIRITQHIFNIATSINSLTLELPEIFYRVERKADEPLIFSGRTHTINIEEERRRTDKETSDKEIIIDAINHGLYQQTLILIKQTGVRGLKLNVWSQSILKNFFDSCSSSEREEAEKRCDIDVIEWFLALARNNLLEVQSSESIKNDLRAFLPRKPLDYFAMKQKYKGITNEGVSDSPLPRADKRKNKFRILREIQRSERELTNPTKPNQSRATNDEAI